LRGEPVVVGGKGDPTQRAMVATASYAAREFGIRSGMPLRSAARRCPEAAFLPSDPPTYETASEQVMATLRRFPVVVEVLGWDEAFLGVHTGDPEALAAEAQRAVKQATGLVCSVGIGDNRLRAKLATAFAKPAGIYRLTRHNWIRIMGERPTKALLGHRPQDREEAGRRRHHHRLPARGHRHGRAGATLRSHNGPVVPGAGTGRRWHRRDG
jgi:DNA polymerase IV